MPSQLQRKATDKAKVKAVNSGSAHEGKDHQSNDCTSTITMDVVESANARSSSKRSGTTIANLGRSEKTQTCVASEASSNVMLSNESPVTNNSLADGSDKTQGCCSFASTDTNNRSSKEGPVWCSTSTSYSYRNESDGILGSTASGARTNLTSSSNGSAVSVAGKSNSERSQIGVSADSSASNVHVSSGCRSSSTVTVNMNRSPAASTSRQRNTKAVSVGDHDLMFSSSDEEAEDMDWGPADDSCAVERDHDSEHNFEGVQNNSSSSRSMKEAGSKDKQLAGRGADSSRGVVSEEMSCELSTAVNSKESTVSCQHGNFVSSLPDISNQVLDITSGGNVKRSQMNNKKTKKSVRKSRRELNVQDSSPISVERVSTDRPNSLVTRFNASCNSDGGDKEMNAFKNVDFPGMDVMLEVIIEEVEEEDKELSSTSIERISVEQPASRVTRLNASCNSDSDSKEVNAIESTDFPGMDDMLQVIEEEDEDRAESQCETNPDDMNLDEGYADVNCLGLRRSNCNDRGSSEKHFTCSKEHVIRSNEHVITSPGRELTIEETQECIDCLRLGCNTLSNSSTTEQGVVEDESLKDTSNGYDDVGSDERGANVSDQQPRVDSAPVIQRVHDKEARKETFSNSLARVNQKVGHSRGLTCDQVHMARDRSGHIAGTRLNLPRAKDSEDTSKRDGEGNMLANTDGETPLPQFTDKISNHQKERNFSAKPALNKRMPTKSTTPNTSKARLPRPRTTPKKNCEAAEPFKDVSKVKFRSKNNIFTYDLQTLELLWNFKGK